MPKSKSRKKKSTKRVLAEPRLAFNRTVILRYRIHLEQGQYAIDGMMGSIASHLVFYRVK